MTKHRHRIVDLLLERTRWPARPTHPQLRVCESEVLELRTGRDLTTAYLMPTHLLRPSIRVALLVVVPSGRDFGASRDARLSERSSRVPASVARRPLLVFVQPGSGRELEWDAAEHCFRRGAAVSTRAPARRPLQVSRGHRRSRPHPRGSKGAPVRAGLSISRL